MSSPASANNWKARSRNATGSRETRRAKRSTTGLAVRADRKRRQPPGRPGGQLDFTGDRGARRRRRDRRFYSQAKSVRQFRSDTRASQKESATQIAAHSNRDVYGNVPRTLTRPRAHRNQFLITALMGQPRERLSELEAGHASHYPCHPYPPRDRRVAGLALQRWLGLLSSWGTWNNPDHPSHSCARWRHLALISSGQARPSAASRQATSTSDAWSCATVRRALRVDCATPVSIPGPPPCPRPPPAPRRA